MGNRNIWHRALVNDRVKIELKAWISRYVKRDIWMYEYAFSNAITRNVSDCIVINMSHSSLYDIYFIHSVGEERELYLPTFLEYLLIPRKQGVSLVVKLKQVDTSSMEKTKVEMSTKMRTEELDQNEESQDTRKKK